MFFHRGEKWFLEFGFWNVLRFLSGFPYQPSKEILTKIPKHFKIQIIKIIFLHDEKTFLSQFFSYDLEYISRVQENTLEHPRECTGRGRSRNWKMRHFFVLNVIWEPSGSPTSWILCAAGTETSGGGETCKEGTSTGSLKTMDSRAGTWP